MKMHFFKKCAALLCLGAIAVSGSGCLAVAAGAGAAGAVAYVRGGLEVTYDADLQRVHQAAEAVLRDLDFSIENSRRDQVSGIVEARTSRDRQVQVDLERSGTGETSATIRVGTFGDQELSMMIHERIQARL